MRTVSSTCGATALVSALALAMTATAAPLMAPGAGLRGRGSVSSAPSALRSGTIDETPQQIHIAFAGNDGTGVSNAMAASWVTVDTSSAPTVRYGVSSGVYTAKASGQSNQYLDTHGGTWNHHAVMTSLKPSTKYFYVVGDAQTGVWSDEYSFTTAPANAAETGEVNILLNGDMGVYNSGPTRAAIDKMYDQFDFIWHVGDISYADDAFLHHPFSFHYEKTWDEYMNWLQNVTANKAYMVLPGNHEAECHSAPCLLENKLRHSLHNFTAYNSRFRMPWRESGAVSNMWYSYNYGPVHFISINTETDFPGSPNDSYTGLNNGGFGDQLAWLEQDLIKANQSRSERPWVLVAGHRPVYSIGNTDGGNGLSGPPVKLAAAVEDLFYKYKVDVYFCGHQHSYERQWPVYKSNPELTYTNPAFTTYIVQGAAGTVEGHTHYPMVHPHWSAFRNTADYGFGMIKIFNSTTLHWAFIGSESGKVIDEITLVREH